MENKIDILEYCDIIETLISRFMRIEDIEKEILIKQIIEKTSKLCFFLNIHDKENKEKNLDYQCLFLVGTLEYQIYLLKDILKKNKNFEEGDMRYIKSRGLVILTLHNKIAKMYDTKKRVRPRGRTPKGFVWDVETGNWVKIEDYSNDNEWCDIYKVIGEESDENEKKKLKTTLY